MVSLTLSGVKVGEIPFLCRKVLLKLAATKTRKYSHNTFNDLEKSPCESTAKSCDKVSLILGGCGGSFWTRA